MPRRNNHEPAENEIECGRCGAHFYYELTRCPNCGVNVYEPEDDLDPAPNFLHRRKGLWERIRELWHHLFRKPYSADEIFGASLDQAILYNDLLERVAGDRPTADRLIEYERQRAPRATRLACIKNAIERWDKDNMRFGNSA
jgi:hypothetical protein